MPAIPRGLEDICLSLLLDLCPAHLLVLQRSHSGIRSVIINLCLLLTIHLSLTCRSPASAGSTIRTQVVSG